MNHLVLFYTSSLFDATRLHSTDSVRIEVVRTSKELLESASAATVCVIDLSDEASLGLIEELRRRCSGQLIGYGPHVMGERLKQAKDLGLDQVLARSRFFGSLGPNHWVFAAIENNADRAANE